MTITAERLTKRQRDELPDEHFAVPGKKKLPIHDERHTRLAWDMVDKTQDLSDEERRDARTRILHRAKQLGVDTKDWHKMKALALRCMSLNIDTDDDHPNKMPFTGVLTKLDVPSDEPPGGANGKRIIVDANAARKALSSLLGMAVDFTPSFDGHDTQAKIGIITSADIVGNELQISGFVYAADFPNVADMIQKLKNDLGFSFEAQRLQVEDMSADILRIIDLTFTGAAILLKDKAAYTTTSLAASAEGEIEMTAEELKALLGPMLAEALKPVTDRLDKVEKDIKPVTDSVQASAATRAMVEPHCSAMDACHAAMEAAGVGTHPKFGHVQVLRRMSDSMRAEAAIGKIPHIWRDHDYPYEAARDNRASNPEEDDLKKDEVEKLIAAAVTQALEPLTKELKDTKDKLATAETTITDLKASKRDNAPAPDRKTVPPMVTSLMARAGIGMPEEGKTLPIAEVDKLLASASIPLTQRIMVKNGLTRAGVLA